MIRVGLGLPGASALVYLALGYSIVHGSGVTTGNTISISDAEPIVYGSGVTTGKTLTVGESFALVHGSGVTTGKTVIVGDGDTIAHGSGATTGKTVIVGESFALVHGSGTTTGKTVIVGESFSVVHGSGTTTGKTITIPQSITLANVSFDAWWNGDNYNASTGVATGQSSAGTSGSWNTTSAGHNPTAGNAVNGHTGMILDATKYLTTGRALSTFIGASTFSMFVVCTFSAAEASDAYYVAGAVLQDNASYTGLGSVGPNSGSPRMHTGWTKQPSGQIDIYNGSADGFALNTLGIYEIVLDGSGVVHSMWNHSTDRTVSSAASINTTGMGDNAQLFSNYNNTSKLSGTVYEVLTSKSDLTNQRTAIRQTLATKYGITLP